MRITVISGARRCGVDCADGEDLLSVLRKNGFLLPAGCGGRGTCGKCRVRVSGGRYGVRGREVLACRTPAEEGLCVRVGQYRGGGLTEGLSAPFACDGEEGVGLAVDIGTTTVAFALCDLADGKILEKYACLNSQSGFGADVISRIRAAETGSAGALRDAIRGQVGEALGALRKKYGLHSVKKAAVCGNTAMLHFFCGEDASGIGRAPFTPAFTEYRSYAGAELGLEAEEVQVLPSVSAFVGADVTAGCIAVGLDREEGMLADIGTNGEMFAHAQGRMLCTSAAAGPCFEGANIECGMGGVDGAIDSVRAEGDGIACTTVGGARARGICGAGLVDAVALLAERGIVDETGAFAQGDRFTLAEGVYITQRDIRNFQLAKSAVCSAIAVLAGRAGLPPAEMRLYLAGGLGFYLNAENACRVGLLPRGSAADLRAVGNAALAGTVACMLGREQLLRAQRLAAAAEYIDLSADAAFLDEFVGNMELRER